MLMETHLIEDSFCVDYVSIFLSVWVYICWKSF